ncbi:MAG: hypothetical protein GTO24_09870 [candidate division Zixibacteria bacterium]|nr:hypothetical protein [candidate division Zixibacteria bacterium]
MTKIVNSTNKRYLINVEGIVARILERIPDWYKEGLEKIELIHEKRRNQTNPEYHLDNEKDRAYVKLYLEDVSHTSLPLISRIFISMSVVLSIEDHYKRYLRKKHPSDPKFQPQFNVMNALYLWGELGIWKSILWLYWKVRGSH